MMNLNGELIPTVTYITENELEGGSPLRRNRAAMVTRLSCPPCRLHNWEPRATFLFCGQGPISIFVGRREVSAR
jgi:hypothetical protein